MYIKYIIWALKNVYIMLKIKSFWIICLAK